MRAKIDIGFDFRRDAKGRDPDAHSKTLRSYHRMLWSKPLPDGHVLDLDDTTPGSYLHHRSSLGDFSLASDTVVPSFDFLPHIHDYVSEAELQAFNTIGYTIGAMMVFPGKQVDGKWTINQARGCTRQIRDRFDLTLECIRRHYAGGRSPLADVLLRYGDFFALFKSFRGYVEFFLLEDLVAPDFAAVHISGLFDDFARSPIPGSAEEYSAYKNASIAFIEARNRRIQSSLTPVA